MIAQLAVFVVVMAIGFALGFLGAGMHWQARWIRYLESKHAVHVPKAGEPEGHVTLPGPSPEEEAARLGMLEATEKLADYYLQLAEEENKPLDREGALAMARASLLQDTPGGALT